jgi:UDP-N-acetylmuramate dehydrogenase
LNELVILDATFQFESEPAETLTKRMQKLWIHRQTSQPSSMEASAYVFRDPSGVSATSLIEQSGMKGTKVGEVEICDKDPNFIVAHPGATSADFLRLVELMKAQVHERTGVELELNLEIW